MAYSRKRDCNWKIVLQFALIILISACIAGVVGGVTSKVSKFRSAEVVRNGTVGTTGNATVSGDEGMRGSRMVARVWVG